MLKQKSRFFELVFSITDLIVISIAWISAYFLRFRTDWIAVDKGIPNFDQYLLLLAMIFPIWFIVYRSAGLYKTMRGANPWRELWLLFNANVLSNLILVAVIYFFKEKSEPYSRLVFVYFGILSISLNIIFRLLLRFVLRGFRKRGYNLRYLLLVGAGKVAADIASRIRLHKELGISLVGCLSKDGTEDKGPWGMPLLGGYNDIAKVLASQQIDQVVIALPLSDSNHLPEVVSQLKDSLVDVKIVPDIYQFISVGGAIEEFEGLPVIGLQESPLAGMSFLFKRVIDLILAAVMLVIFSVPMLIIALFIKLTSKGPIFFSQERVSYDGHSFRIYKFRTMKNDSEKGWTKFNDSRITAIGRFLRKTSLDELPQIFNVLKGDMSVVGPRPERPVYIEDFRRKLPNYYLRHKVPAGITGWAQINGWRGDTSIDKRLEFDLYYIENWSVLLDLKIIILTVFKGFINKNAY